MKLAPAKVAKQIGSMRHARNEKYKKNLKKDSSRESVLAKTKVTTFRGKVKRFGYYNVIASHFAELAQELRALHAAVNGDVAAVAELKSTWDARMLKVRS